MKIIGLSLRIIIAVCAAVFLLWACSFINAGAVLGIVIFGSVIAACVLWKPLCGLIKRLWKRIGGRIALISLGVLIVFCVGMCAVFSVNMAIYIDEPVENVRAVMIPGCKVEGEEPSQFLRARLDAALAVLSENPGAVCVVSGGKGGDELISEAECMRRYLVSHGIAEERIFPEDKSISTRENFRFSKEIFDGLGISDGIVVTTNEFHQFRTELYARRVGLDVGHSSAATPIAFRFNYWLREWLALMSVLVLG